MRRGVDVEVAVIADGVGRRADPAQDGVAATVCPDGTNVARTVTLNLPAAGSNLWAGVVGLMWSFGVPA